MALCLSAVVLVSFIALTGESKNVRLVLQNICVQLVQAYSPGTELSEVQEYFNRMLLCTILPLLILLCIQKHIYPPRFRYSGSYVQPC